MANLTYYKCTSEDALKASQEREQAMRDLKEKGKIFAEYFGGELLGNNSITGFRLTGLHFNPPKDINLWTKPNQNDNGVQFPRLKVTKEFKEASSKLLREYKEKFPIEKVEVEPLLNAIGTTWGNVLFNSGGFEIFGREDAIYVASCLKLNEHCKEILASEFFKAKNSNSH